MVLSIDLKGAGIYKIIYSSIDKETGDIYKSAAEVIKIHGFPRDAFYNWLNGRDRNRSTMEWNL